MAVLTGGLSLLFSHVNTPNCLQIHDAADVNQSSTLAKLVCLHVQWCETKFQIPSILNKLEHNITLPPSTVLEKTCPRITP